MKPLRRGSEGVGEGCLFVQAAERIWLQLVLAQNISTWRIYQSFGSMAGSSSMVCRIVVYRMIASRIISYQILAADLKEIRKVERVGARRCIPQALQIGMNYA